MSVVAPDVADPTTATGLKRTMEQRHLVMTALGGVVCSGLSVSSGYTIGEADPLGAVLALIIVDAAPIVGIDNFDTDA
jgi:S-methylmethionine transporter